MACFLPLRPLLFLRPLGFSASEGIRLQSSKGNILSCTFVPPRRFHLKPAVQVLPSYVTRTPVSSDTLRLKLLGLSAYSDPRALLFTPLERRRLRVVALTRRSHALGFGYPLNVLLL